MIQPAMKNENADGASAWLRFAHMVRANDSFLALLIGAWLATFSIFLMDNFRTASAQLSTWNVVRFEMQTNAAGVEQMMPVITALARSQSGYREGRLPMPEPLLVRGDDLVINNALINLFGKDADPFLNYYAEARNVNRTREAFLDFLNTGPTMTSKAGFFSRVQGFYITLAGQLSRLQADTPAAMAVTQQNWKHAARNSAAKSLFFYGMLAAAALVSVLYLFVRRATEPAMRLA